MFFLSPCCQSPFPHWESQPTSGPWDALQHYAGLWTCCGGSSDSNLVLLLCVLASMSTAVRTSVLSSVGALNALLYIPKTQNLPSWSCGFNLQLVHLVGRFWSSSLVTLPLGFNCGFISTSACGPSTGVCSWGCSRGLGSVPVRARCGGGAAAWVAGVLAAPGTQGSWWLGSRKFSALQGYGN